MEIVTDYNFGGDYQNIRQALASIEDQLHGKGIYDKSIVVDERELRVKVVETTVYLRAVSEEGRGYSGDARLFHSSSYHVAPKNGCDAVIHDDCRGAFNGFRPFTVSFFIDRVECPSDAQYHFNGFDDDCEFLQSLKDDMKRRRSERGQC